jgi:hypothetical protein
MHSVCLPLSNTQPFCRLSLTVCECYASASIPSVLSNFLQSVVTAYWTRELVKWKQYMGTLFEGRGPPRPVTEITLLSYFTMPLRHIGEGSILAPNSRWRWLVVSRPAGFIPVERYEVEWYPEQIFHPVAYRFPRSYIAPEFFAEVEQ